MSPENKIVVYNKGSVDNKEIFQHPFSCLITAPRGSGKSNLVVNLLNRPDLLKNKFDEIYYFSPTIYLDQTLEHLNNKKIFKCDEISNDKLNNLLESVKEDEERQKILIVLDDCIEFVNNKKSSAINKLFFKGRHFSISVVVITQKYKAVNPLLRQNALLHIFFRPNNNQELDAIVNELNNRKLPENKLREIFNKYTQNYDFIIYNIAKSKVYHIFREIEE